MLALLCYSVAFILWVVASVGVPSRVNLVAAGLAAAILPTLVHVLSRV